MKMDKQWNLPSFLDFSQLYLSVISYSIKSLNKAVCDDNKEQIKSSSFVISNSTEQLKNIFHTYQDQVKKESENNGKK